MSKKKPDKIIPTLEASFGEVLVCKKNDLQPYLKIFIQEPENISQQNLGTLAGIFEITDESEDSSYVVNYLVSVIKKEYYAKAKRGPIESFESALHKANLALAKLAEHENIGWIGKIDAVILVIEKNNIHLSQTGTSKAFLLRGKSLTDISEDAPSAENPNPLKTFTDVLSGRAEQNDKIIMATKSLLDVFSFEEIKRSMLRFSSPEFIQFLKTALGNELEKVAVLFIEINKKIILEKIKSFSSEKSEVNAFSQAAFSKAPKGFDKNKAQKAIDPEEKKAIISEIKEQIKKENGEFVDKKTGHIYIKEDHSLKEDGSVIDAFFEVIYSKISDWLSSSMKTLKTFTKKKFALKMPRISVGNIFTPLLSSVSKSADFLLTKIKTAFSRNKPAPVLENKIDTPLKLPAIKLFPNISKIKNIFSSFDYSRKLYAILAIIILLVVPYLILKIQNKNPEEPNIHEDAIPAILIPLENDKNVVRVDILNQTFSEKDLLGIIKLRDRILATNKKQIFDIENNRAYTVPEDFGSIELIFNMDDLNLLFLANSQRRILSWSPVSEKFEENQIVLPENSDIYSIKTYFTYLYALDKKNNQIYRYPRAQEGFGEKTDWLKESLDLNQVVDMAINDSIFLAEVNNVIKLFKGKKEDFNIELTDTPIKIDRIYTERDSQNIYLLDTTSSRIIKLDLSGNIISQYYNSEISEALEFFADEKNGLLYFTSKINVKSFSI